MNGAPANERRDSVARLVVTGYIMALAMPPVGFILAIVVAFRPGKAQPKQGLLIVLVGIVASVVWIVIITSGALSTTGNNY